MSINFDTENLIIVHYPQGAGGKFLINCLGLSDDAVLQSNVLAEQQLYQKFTQLDKFKFLKEQLTYVSVREGWNDLHLGCKQLFGVDTSTYSKQSSEFIKNSSDLFYNIVNDLSNGDKKFFIVAHGLRPLAGISRVWNCARIINFINYQDFINFRKDFDLVDASSAENKLFRSVYTTAILWDTNNYFSVDSTVDEIRKLYVTLDLNDFNEDLIREYHMLWIDKLTEINSKFGLNNTQAE